MKTKISIVVTVILLLIVGVFAYMGWFNNLSSWFERKMPTTAISCIGDVSDPGLMDESPQTIVDLYGLNDDTRLYEGVIFRTRFISASDDHNVSEYRVEPVNNWFLGNATGRVERLREFKDQVTKAIEELEKEEIKEQKASLVYENFVREAEALMGTKSDRKILVCMTDLLQHSDDVNLYCSRDLEQAKVNPRGMIARFKKIAPLPKLDGMVIYFLHRCKSYEEQKRYNVAVKLFSQMALEAGASEVHVGPNIVTHE